MFNITEVYFSSITLVHHVFKHIMVKIGIKNILQIWRILVFQTLEKYDEEILNKSSNNLLQPIKETFFKVTFDFHSICVNNCT